MDKRFEEYERLRRRLKRVWDAQVPLSMREAGLTAKIWALLTPEESRFARSYIQGQNYAKPQLLIARELLKLRWRGHYVLKTRSERKYNGYLAKSARTVPLEGVPFVIAFCVTFLSGCTVNLHGRNYHVWMDRERGLVRKRV